MMNKRNTLILSLLLVLYVLMPSSGIMAATRNATVKEQKSTESLNYTIYVHMGFIWAKAGYGGLTFYDEKLSDGTTQKHGRLAAKSLNIVEHIMKVRDTLDCWFNADMVPTAFRKGTHEGSYNAIAQYAYHPYWNKKSAAHTPKDVDSTYVEINRWRKKGKDEPENQHAEYTNPGVAYDMLSVFYSIRNLDYAHMAKGKKMQFVCYDGTDSQIINVEYQGAEKCTLRNDKEYDAYLIYLTFDTKGQDATPLKVWVTRTSDHRPVKAVIALKRIGSVHCEIDE